MAISDKDIKLLWGRAAGHCSAPGCHADLTPLLAKSGLAIIGEMAHVIGRKPGAARSDISVGEDNTYDNLILLCPNHHTLVDKAENDYSADLLRKWKADWEEQVGGLSQKVKSRSDLFHEVATRLAENNQIHSEWGPTSSRAKETPQSSQAARIWQLRRLAKILPNNRSIMSILINNKKLLTIKEWKLAIKFIDHAEFYEGHCVDPKDSSAYMAFPVEFSNLIENELLNE